MVGIPIPSTNAISIAKHNAKNWLSPAIASTIAEKRPPRPVRPSTPTMIPAHAQTATSWMDCLAPSSSASSESWIVPLRAANACMIPLRAAPKPSSARAGRPMPQTPASFGVQSNSNSVHTAASGISMKLECTPPMRLSRTTSTAAAIPQVPAAMTE